MKIDQCLPRFFVTRPDASRKQHASHAIFSLATSHQAPPVLMSTMMVSMAQSLLKIQEIPDCLEKRREAKKRGEALLGLLELLQLQLLGEERGPALLEALETAKDLGSHQTQDLYLRDILEQIELRAAIVLTQLKKQVSFSS
jgi:Class II flagellar assembly regulator